MTAPRIEIVVDEVVLRGVAPERAHAVAAALESRLAELGERWAAGGPPAPRAREESLRRPAAIAAPADSPAALGGAVADAVFDTVVEARR